MSSGNRSVKYGAWEDEAGPSKVGALREATAESPTLRPGVGRFVHQRLSGTARKGSWFRDV